MSENGVNNKYEMASFPDFLIIGPMHMYSYAWITNETCGLRKIAPDPTFLGYYGARIPVSYFISLNTPLLVTTVFFSTSGFDWLDNQLPIH